MHMNHIPTEVKYTKQGIERYDPVVRTINGVTTIRMF